MGSEKLSGVSVDQMENLVENMMWFWGNLYQRWRAAAEDEYGVDAALKLELKFIGSIGKSHARGIKSILNVPKGIAGFIEAYRFVPENFVEGFRISEQTDKYVVVYNPSCSVQKARTDRGKREFPCKESGILYFTAFAREIDPDIRLSCIVCPPDDHPDDCFCKWKIEVV